ncbi:MAG: Asp-tRNA(Asn)/Glu-tRNA(Gln) amidotransferase GatCAB subunit B, partial [Candidatus Vecturithrix sp.]|nr:Asp-tRNA(Asn)/Glu-tRNA(Gln) amidotransferase GatCAB subunit B [Candidatus Vecturithrix sp.]
ICEEWNQRLKAELPELAGARQPRIVEEYQLPEYDAEVLTSSKHLATYYEECVRLFPNPKVVSNWVMGDILHELKQQNADIRTCPVSPAHLADMLKLVENNTISGKIAKTVFEDMYATGKMPAEIVNAKGLVQISDEAELEQVIERILAENPDTVAQYREGKTKTFGFFVGQVMKATKGKANPQLVNTLLKHQLEA